LAPPTCDCGAAAGLSGHCPACDRISLQPRHAGVPEPPKKADVGSLRLHAKPPPGLLADSLGLRSAAPAKPVAVHQTSPVRVQTQMRVSSPSDAAEQEATAVGRQIMRMPNPDDPAPPSISRGSAGVAQRLAAPNGERHVDPHILDTLRASSSSGSPLPRDMRSFMEPRFKSDFSGVRIHTDQHAARLAAQLGARAFTVGRDIYFAKGEFQPNKPEGWELVAHELTHTLQQGGAAHAPVAPPTAPALPAKQAAAAQSAKALAGAAHAPATAAPAKPPPKPAPTAAKPAPPKAVAAAPGVHDANVVMSGAVTSTPAPGLANPAAATTAQPGPAAKAPVPAKPAPTPAARVAQKASPSIQRLGISDVLDWIADHANDVPGFRMLTIILGVNPINMAPVDRSAANVLRAIIEFLPGGSLITQALDNAGIIEKAGAWVSDQLSTLAMSGAALKQALMDFLNSLSWTDIFHPGDVWDRAKRIFTEPIGRIIDFVKGLVTGILKLIKDAILLPLAKLAEGTRGWDLLIAVLGKNPITGDSVERSAENLIGGFLKLIDQEEVWENMKKANAIQRAWAWFQSTISQLVGFVSQIPDLFIAAFKSLTIQDVVFVVGAFQKVASVFGGFLVNFISWAGNALWELLKIIFQVVSPGLLEYLQKTGSALKAILKDPLPFVKNLVAAAKLGLSNFADHFGAHLKQSLIDWLTGSLEGVYIPHALTLVELGKFALSVLGISWAQIRAKIVKALGPNGETIMKAMETGFDIVVALIKGGVGAAWELIKEKLTNLKDMVIDGIVGFVTDTIIQKAIPKLVSLFIPGAGFISAIVSIYDTIKVFVEKLSKIIAVVKAFVDGIVAIAAGQIAGAAGKVESALGDVLTLVINFLANFLGLTGITKKIMDVVHKVQAFVDKALDTAISFVIGKAKAFIAKLFGGKDKKDGAKDPKWITAAAAINADLKAMEVASPDGKLTQPQIEAKLPAWKAANGFTSLRVTPKAGNYDIMGAMSPEDVVAEAPAEADGRDKDHPVDFAWVKPAAAAYPAITLAPPDQVKTTKAKWGELALSDLSKLPGKFTVGPTSSKSLTSMTIGVAGPYRIADGMIFQAKSATTRGSTVDKFNSELKDWGYNRNDNAAPPTDGDHVMELQVGGPDDPVNIWPLNASINRSSGGAVKRERERILTALAISDLNGRWLRIKMTGGG
jgi:hypothetical protein